MYGFKDLLYRLSHSINVPYEELTAFEISEEGEINEDVGFPLWKVESASRHYGQTIGDDRVWRRDAYISAKVLLSSKKEVEDDYKISNLEIGYSKSEPRREYIKRRKAEIKQKKNADIGRKT